MATTQSLSDIASEAHDEMRAVLAALEMVPEFMSLGSFPDHCAGPVCWCRPRIVAEARGFMVIHKDLHKGEFDG